VATVAKPHIERRQRFVWLGPWSGSYERAWACGVRGEKGWRSGPTPVEAYRAWSLTSR
jgi:hypothetical protein